MADTVQNEPTIDVAETDLPLHCPMPRTPVWCYHPRVFLDVVGSGGEVLCPYCGTKYRYRGEAPRGH